jgi:hypothetical protein
MVEGWLLDDWMVACFKVGLLVGRLLLNDWFLIGWMTAWFNNWMA